MKHLNCILLTFFLLHTCLAQGGNTGGITRADSILLRQIEDEPEPGRRHRLIKDLILLSDDKAPLPLLEEAKVLYELSQNKKDAYLETFALSMYGQGYRITGNFTKALQYHFKAIEMAKALKDNSVIGYALNQSAHIYKDREENEKAIEVYKQSIEYSKTGDIEVFRFYPYMNLGFVYLNANHADSALHYSSQAVRMLDALMKNEKPDNRAIIERSLYVYTLSNLASAYSKMKDKAQADYYFNKALQIVNTYSGSKTRYFQFFFFNLAKHYQRYQLIDSSLYAARQAILSVAGTPVGYLASGPAKMLSDYYEKVNADSAVKYLKLYLQGNEVMNSTRVTQQLQMMTVEEEERKAEIERAEQSYRQKLVLYSLVGGLVLLAFFATYMVRANRIRQRINKEISQQKNQLEQTLGELKATQAQLIQSEKMASLGELTAGIAHEIQNPLNFVNNFSEVSNELISEMVEEVDRGNTKEVKEIARDVQQNLEKILHHGKRADAIVRGMLQHSRTSTGQKEPTDINALADEYLRLAYHGLRAKDNAFSASFKTDLDPVIGNIKIVPQDIGRVLLNLINNAFYAVDEKKRQQPEGYEPTVTVSTKKRADKVEIKVSDNGNGIPENIREKIFQPFFTTKPTGQGTGLGLSLSYDIVTKGHGGEIQVQAKVDQGTSLVVLLPI
jgi:signal transduction histidine kinase